MIPSLPGYGFSGKPTTTGWDPDRIARAWTELMKRLGYTQYVAQGGDWGAIVTDLMGVQAPPELARHPHQHAGRGSARHRQRRSQSGGAGAVRPLGRREARVRPAATSSTSRASATRSRWRRARRRCTGSRIRPSAWPPGCSTTTRRSLALIARAFAGQPEGLTRDDVLDNITLYWLTNTAVSSARLYWENKLGFFAAKGVSIPAAVSVFPDELYQAPRSWAEQAYPNLIHYNKLDKGGHFAAWEQPQLFSEELRAGFRSLR